MSAREAGPALDAEVQERVFGNKVTWWKLVGSRFVLCPADSDGARPRYKLPQGRYVDVDAYSTEGSAMLQVIERMRALGFAVSFTTIRDREQDQACRAWFNHAQDRMRYGWATADTLPHAVALAALAALDPTNGS